VSAPPRTAPPRTALLDVNLLVALAWPNHTQHAAARHWFDSHSTQGWATTPITESGFVRVSSNRSAIPTATSPALAIEVLTAITGLDGHQFWLDDVAMVTSGLGDATLIRTHRDVTDAHLLALTQRHDGVLVTFDAHLARMLGARPAELVWILS
jgi:toxin-antitoxin system PIN domain toxin